MMAFLLFDILIYIVYKSVAARLAQLVEQSVYTGKVASSSLASRTETKMAG